jgi:murein DD-endopeptidase MepM/ murein hydrolase activator NlpD
MTVRSDNRIVPLKLIFAFLAGALLAGCEATPSTQFDWGVNTRVRHTAAARQSTAYRSAEYREVPVPTPRPAGAPGWYEDHPRDTARADPEPDTAPNPSSVGDMQFMWPVNGRVISSFGSSSDGVRNDGIDIATADGEPIRASASGTVSYEGDELKSYGNLVLIRHEGGYVTAYAHASRIVVRRGDRVAKGQVIAYVGNTGDVHSPQLHFEIRHGVEPVDPRPLLGPLQVASRF